jgi:hypothetical protein
MYSAHYLSYKRQSHLPKHDAHHEIEALGLKHPCHHVVDHKIPKNLIFIRESHTMEMHSLVTVLITNVETVIANIIANTLCGCVIFCCCGGKINFVRIPKMMSVIAYMLHFSSVCYLVRKPSSDMSECIA